jgi:hypothetical protein
VFCAFHGQRIGAANRSVAAPWEGDDPLTPIFHLRGRTTPDEARHGGDLSTGTRNEIFLQKIRKKLDLTEK